MPLGRAIGPARVVALGEPAHAEGNMFAAQARLVTFLRERLGFTVLAWEAGLWSCETDAMHCVGSPWGSVVETRSARALVGAPGFHVTGFDFQLSGTEREASRDRLSATLANALSGDPPLLARLKYMRSFAAAWTDEAIVQAPLAQLTWYHHLALLEKVDGPEHRLWCARQAIEHGWSRNVLVAQIETGPRLRRRVTSASGSMFRGSA